MLSHIIPRPQDAGRIQVVQREPNWLDLIIDNLQPDDSSNYTCIAENAGGMMERNGTIIVYCELSNVLDKALTLVRALRGINFIDFVVCGTGPSSFLTVV